MEITAVLPQEVNLGSNVIFTETIVPGSCSIIHTDGSGLVKVRGLSGCQSRARFKVAFNGNIALPAGGTAGPISLAISVDGEGVEATRMIVTPTAVESFFNVSASIYLDIPKGCCATIGVTNTAGPAITVQNANLIVERVA